MAPFKKKIFEASPEAMFVNFRDRGKGRERKREKGTSM